MTDEYEYDDEGDENSTVQALRAQVKDQAAKLRELDDLREKAAQAEALARENAFYRADLPRELTEAQRKAIQAIAEEHTAEGFSKAAQDLGFMKAPEPSVSNAELEAHDRISNVAGSGGMEVDAANYEAEIAQAKTVDEVFAVKAKYGMGGRAVTQ